MNYIKVKPISLVGMKTFYRRTKIIKLHIYNLQYRAVAGGYSEQELRHLIAL